MEGQGPGPGRDGREVLRGAGILNREPEVIGRYSYSVPAEVESIVRKALEKADDSDRPQIVWALVELKEPQVFQQAMSQYRQGFLSKVERLGGGPAFDTEKLAKLVSLDELAKLAEKVRNLKEHGLAEGVSTRLLVYAGRLIAGGISPRNCNARARPTWASAKRGSAAIARSNAATGPLLPENSRSTPATYASRATDDSVDSVMP